MGILYEFQYHSCFWKFTKERVTIFTTKFEAIKVHKFIFK